MILRLFQDSDQIKLRRLGIIFTLRAKLRRSVL